MSAITVKQLRECIADMPDDYEVVVYIKYSEPTISDDKFPVTDPGNVFAAEPYHAQFTKSQIREFDEARALDGLKPLDKYHKTRYCCIMI